MILLALLLSLALLFLAGLHGWWGLGGIWPAPSERDLARSVIGDGRTRMPPPWQCYAVAMLLAVIAVWPWLILVAPSDPIVVTGAVAIAGVFFARCLVAYSPRWRAYFSAEPFATHDKRLYAPLCLTLAVGFVALLEREI